MQDLDRQLHEMRQQLERYKALVPRSLAPANSFAAESILRTPSRELSDMPSVDRSPQRFLKAKIPQDLSPDVRTYLTDYGRGLLKAPMRSITTRRDAECQAADLASLPPAQVANTLLYQYEQGVHRYFPVIHWPTLLSTRNAIYSGAAPSAFPRSAVALLFSVFACGCLFGQTMDSYDHGRQYLAMADSIDMSIDELHIDRVRTALLASIFLIEVNDRPSAWRRLGATIRIAQNLSLHISGGQWSTVEGEMRKRIWYSLYSLDR